MSGWWKRGGTSIQPSVPNTRAWPGVAQRSVAVNAAVGPPSKPSSTLSSRSTPCGVTVPWAQTAVGFPSSICANEIG